MNMINMGIKTTMVIYSMSLSNLHNLFIGRTNYNGNESEVRDIIKVMISQARNKFPDFIDTYDNYLNSSNSLKYSNNKLKFEINTDFKTELTPFAFKLFKSLNIDTDENTPDYIKMAEFRSRTTYMNFKSNKVIKKSTLEYIRKIVCEMSHTSVLDGFQLMIDGEIKTCKQLYLNGKLII